VLLSQARSRPPAPETSDDTGWFVVADHGHLFLRDTRTGRSGPVCGLSAPAPPFRPWKRGTAPTCGDCDAYLYDRFLPQVS
jgi:hypothetical protein